MAEPEPHPLTVESPDDLDEPATPAGVADTNFAANVRETRERLKMSQGELARRMSDQGIPYYQQTVRRVEDGKRKVSVGEGGALAEILRTTVDRLTWPGREASTAALLDRVTAKTERASTRSSTGPGRCCSPSASSGPQSARRSAPATTAPTASGTRPGRLRKRWNTPRRTP